jgi:hypothetical protein
MAQQLRILQSLWARERRRTDAAEWPLQTQFAMIRDAGFDGAGVRFIDSSFATEVTSLLRMHGMIWQAQCYPTTIDDSEAGAGTGGAARRRSHQPAAERAAASDAFRCLRDGEGWPMRPVLPCMWKPTATA